MRREIFASSRKSRRKKNTFKAVIFFVAFLAGMTAIVSFFYIPFFKIKSISMSTDGIISIDAVTEIAEKELSGKHLSLFPKSNIFLLPKKNIAKSLVEGIPRIKTVRLDREFFDGLSIQIMERKNKALLCKKESCAAVDEDGFVFEKTPYVSGGIIIKFYDQRGSEEGESPESATGKSMLLPAQFKKIMDFVGLVAKSGGEATEIFLKKEDIYEVMTKEGWRILINAKNEPDKAFANMMTAIESEIKEKRKKLDYIDLRFGNKVYYKFK